MCYRYWWLRIQSLAEREKWLELETFSKMKKSPIGYAPFVDVCLQNHNEQEARKYLSKVSEELKIKYYIKARYKICNLKFINCHNEKF